MFSCVEDEGGRGAAPAGGALLTNSGHLPISCQRLHDPTNASKAQARSFQDLARQQRLARKRETFSY